MSAYLIVNFSVDDPEGYKAYQKGAVPALQIGTAARPLVVDRASEALEGEPGTNTVVLQYESKDAARQAYQSGDYQEVLPIRLGATSNHFCVLVDGFTPPS